MADALLDQGYQLRFIASRMTPEERDATHENIVREVLIGGHGVDASFLQKLVHTARRAGQATKKLLACRRNARVYVITFPYWPSVTFLQFLLLKALGAKIVYIVHDPSPHAWSRGFLRRALERFMIFATYRLSNELISLTNIGRLALAKDFGIDLKRITMVPHGVFDNGKCIELAGNRKFLIFGMLRSNKQIIESIEAFELLLRDYPDSRLVIAGAPYRAEPDYWARCEQAIARLGDAVHCEIGFVAEERLEELFSSTDAVLLPYKDFNSQSGVAVLAAMSMRPVIGTAVGGIAELFDLGLCGVKIQPPVVAESILSGMREFCSTDKQYWQRGVVASRERFLRELDWHVIGKRVVDVALKCCLPAN